MRYPHEATLAAKNRFVNHLSYIIEQLTKDGTTQRDIAVIAKVSPSVIGNIKHGNVHRVSFDIVKRVADALRLEYTITLSSRLGKASQTVTVQSGFEYMKKARLINEKCPATHIR